jgi:glycosyltransferase involved in cell wall biosynthesis
LLPRLRAIRWAYSLRQTSDIHHVTGDIHFLVFGLPRKKTILTIHDLAFLQRGNYLSRFILWLFWVYLPITWISKVTCVSGATKRDIVKYTRCSVDKVKVIPNFVASEFIPVVKKFNRERPVILQIGTAYNKNIERLLESLADIVCHLRIIGHLSEKQLALLTERKTDFSNHYDLKNGELVDEYNQCDIVAFCSTVEGFGLPIIEAQAVGRVVVTSNVSSMPEVAGDAACMVDPFSISSINQGIRKTIDEVEYRDQLIKKGFKNVEKFDLNFISRLYLSLYQSLR